MIKIKNLYKTYHSGGVDTEVLKNISFEIPGGQFIAIIGPSGAGKSTLLYQMGLLDTPSSGSILINNKEVSNLNESEETKFRLHNFGFIFQDYGLIPEFTAEENIMLSALMLDMSREEIRTYIQELGVLLEIQHVLHHVPSQLSGGEQQRVSIARAVVKRPKILFADEPTASLDTKRSREVIDILRKLNKQGQTIVMITHENEYAQLADRIVELRDGEIVKDTILK
ncbi:MAG: ABC-type antimicrobial peptide transport system, ATPase component [Parcubacteria group bacterium GW2011_GWC1_41_7]|nr:MAG: ABC-type antimicrobial peptide transport system, ATPase component [Parcubacteria group bacterium GW2011_GWC1_41_7]